VDFNLPAVKINKAGKPVKPFNKNGGECLTKQNMHEFHPPLLYRETVIKTNNTKKNTGKLSELSGSVSTR